MTTPVTSPTSTPPTTPPTTPSAADNAQSTLSGNFDTFLTLLTSQLQNQDPMSPMDSNQFTQQLVQFSQVEQQINSNKNLETLISLTQSHSRNEAVSYLGKSVTMTDGTAALQNGKADWTYALDGDATTSTLAISDSTGKIVHMEAGEKSNGAHSFSWDGKDDSGNTLPDGAYTLTVRSLLANGKAVSNTVQSKGTVDQVDLTGDEPLLMIGSVGIPLSDASLISGS